MHDPVPDARAYSIFSWVALAVIAAAAAWLASAGRWYDAAALAGLVVLAVMFILAKDGLPRIFTALFLLAGTVNTAGYVFGLWQERTAFDETVHAFTSFTITAAAGWYMLQRVSFAGRNASIMLVLTLIGIVLGVLWEVFEWIIGIIGSTRDTMIDLVMDTIGAIAAGAFCAWAASKNGGRIAPNPDRS